MRCLENNAEGMIINLIQKIGEQLHTIIDGFLDDTSIFVNLQFQQNNLEEVFQKLQAATETWAESLISASGGKLEIQK